MSEWRSCVEAPITGQGIALGSKNRVLRLHERKNNVVILTPEMAGTVGFLALAYLCRYDFSSRMKPMFALQGSLPYERTLLAPITGVKKRVTTLWSLAYTNLVPDIQSLYLDGQHALSF